LNRLTKVCNEWRAEDGTAAAQYECAARRAAGELACLFSGKPQSRCTDAHMSGG
jgi:hypothetical protein